MFQFEFFEEFVSKLGELILPFRELKFLRDAFKYHGSNNKNEEDSLSEISMNFNLDNLKNEEDNNELDKIISKHNNKKKENENWNLPIIGILKDLDKKFHHKYFQIKVRINSFSIKGLEQKKENNDSILISNPFFLINIPKVFFEAKNNENGSYLNFMGITVSLSMLPIVFANYIKSVHEIFMNNIQSEFLKNYYKIYENIKEQKIYQKESMKTRERKRIRIAPKSNPDIFNSISTPTSLNPSIPLVKKKQSCNGINFNYEIPKELEELDNDEEEESTNKQINVIPDIDIDPNPFILEKVAQIPYSNYYLQGNEINHAKGMKNFMEKIQTMNGPDKSYFSK